MVAFLFDTNVISEPHKPVPHPAAMAWLQKQADAGAETYLSVLVVGELWKGVEKIRLREPAKAGTLAAWVESLVGAYADRILPVTTEIAMEWARIAAIARPPVMDGLLAATAKVHRLTFVTRNVADVARTGVPVVNPFEG
jgi:predicted nucleic acid-binding protein